MAFCLAELHLWSTKSCLQVKDTDIGTYQYYDKAVPTRGRPRLSGAAPGSQNPPQPRSRCPCLALPQEHHYYQEKLQFSEARGYSWTPRNRRPEKLRDSLKELEDLLQTSSCIQTRWRNKRCCQVMLSSGVLVYLTLEGPQLQQVVVDRTLTGRLPAGTVTDALLSDGLILVSFLELGQVTAVHLNRKKQETLETGSRTDKLSPSEIKLVSVHVGARGRRLRRRVAVNRLQDVALCWWNLEEPEDEPWTPADTQRNNLVLLSCSPAEGLKVLSSVRTASSPLSCSFSLLQPYQLHTVEVPAGPPGPSGSWADSCSYECSRGRLQRLSVTRIPVPSPPLSCSLHPSETSLLLGLSDSSLVLYDRRRGVSLLACCPVPPALLAWHPAGALVAVGGGQEELVCFDVGLAAVGVALVAEEAEPSSTLRLHQHLRCSGGLQALQWAGGSEGSDGGPDGGLDGGPGGTDLLLLGFHGGPLAALRLRLGCLSGGLLGPLELLQQRLRCGQVREALGVLEAIDWSSGGEEGFQGLSSITNHLLRMELNAETEAQLEAALGVFYCPPSPLPDTLILEYKEPISKYARRFFHHLLRHQRFEKAFLLAVDLEHRDLFMDLHYVAGDKGELLLADASRRRADQLEAARKPASHPLTTRTGGCDSRNQTVTEPPASSTAQTNQSRDQDNIQVSISPQILQSLRHTGRRGADGQNDDEDSEMLRVVHLGTV